MSDKKPSEIAREALRQLAARKLVPTPVNYQSIYNEIAGLPSVQPFPEEPLRQIAQALPARNPGQEKQKGLLEFAIGQRNWVGVQNALLAYANFNVATAAGAAESPPASMSSAAALSAVAGTTGAPALTAEFMEQIARMIEHTLPALGTDDPRFLAQTADLLRLLRDPAHDVVSAKSELARFSHRLLFVAEDQAEIKASLFRLLQHIIENIGQLSPEDGWLKGQTEALLEVAHPPLTLRRLDDVEQRLKDVLLKQGEAKDRAHAAQEELRRMLTQFLERLSEMSESSGVYHDKLEQGLREIEQAHSLEQIAPVLRDVVGATRLMVEHTRLSREELQAMRERAQVSENELARLHQELDRISLQARHDPLTGALNRQGLDEAMHREVAAARRRQGPLCMALLDIDNFKQLNDRKGHVTGDAALTHLATVARECMRPQDTLARYGGEEFVILLPDTPLDKGIEAMTRLQRELTTRFFLADNEQIMITFSAGVAELGPEETGPQAIDRADRAMYLAKRAGKNRVLGA